mgnify:CR=1 FL=1
MTQSFVREEKNATIFNYLNLTVLSHLHKKNQLFEIPLLPKFLASPLLLADLLLILSHLLFQKLIASLRRQMGVMLQDSFIFSGTIMDNIRYGNKEATSSSANPFCNTISVSVSILEVASSKIKIFGSARSALAKIGG